MNEGSSNLVRLPGILLIIILMIFSGVRNIPALLILSTALLILALGARLWARSALLRIRLKGAGQDLVCMPGDEIELPFSLYNDKGIPVIWATLRLMPKGRPGVLALTEELTESQEADHSPSLEVNAASAPSADPASETKPLSRTILWIMPFQEIRWQARMTALKRGIFSLEEASLTSGDGLGLLEYEKKLPLMPEATVTVFPRLIPVTDAPLRRELRELEKSERGLWEDKTLLKNVRPYEPGDRISDINWRQLARTGSLFTNLREKTDHVRVSLSFYFPGFTEIVTQRTDSGEEQVRIVDEEELERMISMTASLLDKMLHAGLHVSLLLPERNEKEGSVSWRLIESGGKVENESILLKELAEIDYTGGAIPLPREEFLRLRHLSGPVFFATKNLTPGLSAWLREMEPCGARAVASGLTPQQTAAFRQVLSSGEVIL